VVRICSCHEATERPAKGEPTGEAQPVAEPVVLIVEHDALLRLVTANSLRDSGFAVIEAANAFEAVLVLASLPVDALLAEIDLPNGMDGLALAQWVYRRQLDTRIILTSGAGRAPCGAEEHACFLPKPFTQAKVEGLLRSILPPPRRATGALHDIGQGTSFPLATEERDQILEGGPNSPLPVVLVLEHDIFERSNKSAALRRQGLEVFEAASLPEAFTVLTKIAVDVLISDVSLIGGTELKRQLQERQPGTRMVWTADWQGDRGGVSIAQRH
jgi:CheY-like chemotaxis protein